MDSTAKNNKTALIHYIGETKGIKTRFWQHLKNIFSLDYGVFDTSALQNGKIKLLWPGFWRIKLNSDPKQMPDTYRKLNTTIIKYINLLEFYVSTLVEDQKTRRNIEGHLAIYLKKSKYKGIYPLDTRTGISPKPLGKTVAIDFNYLTSRQVLGVANEVKI